ncbi:MAG: pseudouridylate synthase [Prevotellaceae bacterium]|nr:pseudouridylate synthase [Prevotellaceae bacterium]
MSEDIRHPSAEFLRSIDVHELLPQQDPFVMIGRLTELGETTITTETLVSNALLFVAEGKLTAIGMMENIAQTCAARIGYFNKYILQDEIRIGYIGAVRNFVANERPQEGETVVTHITVLEEVFGMTLADARMTCGRSVVATAQMKIAVDGGVRK